MVLNLLQVYADGSDGGTVAPYLFLRGTRADGSSGLPAVPANVPLAIDEVTSFSDEIVFVYTVEDGDSSAPDPVLEVDEIGDGDVSFVDLLGREVQMSLSGVSLSDVSSVSIDTAEPFVEAVGSTLNGGEYGVGQVRYEIYQW